MNYSYQIKRSFAQDLVQQNTTIRYILSANVQLKIVLNVELT
jgi:hypothetical protein